MVMLEHEAQRWLMGRWESQTAGNPFLSITAEGEVHGSDGCNVIRSRLVWATERIRFAPFFTTRMACPGVDQWLSRAAEVRILSDARSERSARNRDDANGTVDADNPMDTLQVCDGSGAVIGVLHRAGQ